MSAAEDDRGSPTRRRSVLLALRYYGQQMARLRRFTVPAMLLPALGNTCLYYIAPLLVAQLVGRFASPGQVSVGAALPYVLGFAGVLLAGEILWRIGIHCLKLVGVTETNAGKDAIAAYRLADGKRQWLTDTPDEVHDVVLSGSQVIFVDESDPAYSLEEVGLATGTSRSLGYFTQAILQPGDSGLYAVGGDYLVVNQNGDSSSQAPVAAIKAPAAQG